MTQRRSSSARPLAASEIAAAGDLCERAFIDYPLHVALFPGPARQRTDYVRSLYTAIVADCVLNEPAFLETTSPRNRAWYERLGFESIVAAPAFDDGPTQWAMWREPARNEADEG